jgi:anti-sigma factor RsiW
VDELLSSYIENETSPAENRFIDGHLTVCRRCRSQVDDVAALIPRLRRIPRVTVSPAFTEQVLTRVHGLPTAGLDEPVVPRITRLPLPPLRWAIPLASAAVLALTILAVRSFAPSPDAGRVLAENDRIVASEPLVRPDTPADGMPAVTTLTGTHPQLNVAGGDPQSLGMANDAYVLDQWVLRQPAGGGNPVLTRVGATSNAKVKVTF